MKKYIKYICICIVSLSVHLQKSYEFNKKVIVENLTVIFDDVEVRRTLLSTKTFIFKPSLYNTYYLQLTAGLKSASVDFMDKNYLIFDDHIYRIVNE